MNMTDEVRRAADLWREVSSKDESVLVGEEAVACLRAQSILANAYLDLATRANTGGERERSCEVCSESMAMCQMLRPDDDRKMCLMCFLERTEGGTDTPAAMQPTPASRELGPDGRRAGKTKLVYDKERQEIVPVPSSQPTPAADARRLAVPAEVVEAAEILEDLRQREINLNRVLDLDVMKERPAAFTLATWVRTLAAGVINNE